MALRKLYSISDSPPACSVRMCLEVLGLEYKLIDIDYAGGEHLKEEYSQKNPQKEVPLLDDDGFLLSESIAILQYLADKYDGGELYPKDVQQRAIVNHHLAFNISTYYQRILEHTMLPIFFDYKQTDITQKKMLSGLSVFNTILEKQGKKYSAGDSLTIADLAFIPATICLEAVDYDLSAYPRIKEWYNCFKTENPKLWAIAEKVLLELQGFYKNPPNLSMIHPFHPTRKH